jgi:hypothetical protein
MRNLTLTIQFLTFLSLLFPPPNMKISLLKINNGLKHTLFYLRVEYLQEKSLIFPSCCLKFQTLNKIPSECDNIPAGVPPELHLLKNFPSLALTFFILTLISALLNADMPQQSVTPLQSIRKRFRKNCHNVIKIWSGIDAAT